MFLPVYILGLAIFNRRIRGVANELELDFSISSYDALRSMLLTYRTVIIVVESRLEKDE